QGPQCCAPTNMRQFMALQSLRHQPAQLLSHRQVAYRPGLTNQDLCVAKSDAVDFSLPVELTIARYVEHEIDECSDPEICYLNRIIGEWEQFGDGQDAESQQICSIKQLDF